MTRRTYRTSTRRSAALFTSLLTIAWMFVAALPASAQVITVTLAPPTATNAVGTDHTVTATVTEDAAALEGAVVLFEVSAEGTAMPDTGSVTTDAVGEAEFTFTNSAAVTNTITACLDEDENETCDAGVDPDTAQKTWVVPVPDTITLAPADETNPVDSMHTVTATVLDQLEEPFAGAAVHFDVSGDPTPDPDSGDAVTDAAGEADFAFTNDTAGTNTITACIDENKNEACDETEPFVTAEKIWEERVATTIELTPETGLNQPGEDHSLVALVKDQFGSPIAGVSVEIDVTGGGSPTPSALTQNTNASGQVNFTFTNPVVAVNTITACFTPPMAEPICDTATKSWEEPEPTTIELAPATATNPVDTTHTVTATVLDQFEEPSEAAAVHFDVSGAGTPDPDSGDAATDAAGEADFAFTNDTAGTNTITACIDANENEACDGGEPFDTASKTWLVVTDTIDLAPTEATNPVGTAHILTATVLDELDAPVEGAVVHVSVSGDGAPVPAAGHLTTDAAGEATFVFTNNTAGTNTITACIDVDDSASCDEGEPSATASKVWEDIPPEFVIDLAPASATNMIGTTHTVTATVTDVMSAPAVGQDVHFDVSGSGAPTPASGDVMTDAAGEAEFAFTNASPGSNTIIACVDRDASGTCDAGEPMDAVFKTWVEEECPGFEGDPRNDVIGTGASDTLIGTGAADIICGRGGADEINGKGGKDLLLGGGGNDDIFGKKGNDRLKGGKGKDLLNGGKGTDVCKGGPGKDTIKKCEN